MAEDWYDDAVSGKALAPAGGPSGDWYDEAVSAATPPGTVRRGVAGELGASLARGGLNLANVPYNTGAALTGGVASIYAPRAERTQWEQGQAPQSDRQVLANRIDTQIRDLQGQLGVLAQPPQSLDAIVNNPQAMQRFMATRALTPDQTSAQRAGILQRIADLENQKRQYTELNPLEAASVGFAQTAQGVQGAIDRAVPPTAQAVTGERPWYSPTNIASVTLENAPQIIAQLALTRGMGGLGVGGTAAARFAASGVPIQLSQAMETQNNARLLPGQSPTAQADAVQAGAPYAVLDASLNAVIERLTAKGLIGTDEASQAAARMTLRQRAVGAMRAAPLAGATGAAQETGQEFTSAAVEAGSVNPDAMNADKLLPRLALAGITGGLLEGPLGAASQFTSTGLPSGSTNANASGLDPLPRAPARLDPRMGQAQAVGAPDGQGGVVNPQPNPARLEPGPINAADAAQTPGDVPQGAEGSPGADQAGGPGIDLAAVEAAGRQDAADNLEPEQLPEGTDQAVVDAYTRGYTNGQTTTAQAAPLEDAGTVQLAANERGPAGIDPGSVQEGGVLGDGQGVPDRGGAGAGPVADAGRADVAPGTGSGVDEQSATENPAPRPEKADFGLSRRNGATEDAPVRTPEQQRRMDELRQGIDKMRQREAPSWAESVAAKLEAQAAELTKGPSRLPGNKRGSRSGATTLPAELVALAYRTAARVLRTADRSVASIKSALETLIAQDGKTYTDAEKRGVIRSALRVVRRLDTEQPKKNERKTVTKMLEEVVKGKSQAPTELQREGIRRVSEAVALARADEKAKGLGVIERYDKARKSIRKAIEDNLPPSERGRFLAMLDNAKTPLQVARGMRRVAAAAVSLDARALMKSVDSMSGVMELRKLSAERRAEADDLLAQAEALRPAVGRPDAEDPSKMQAMAAAAKTLKAIDHELAFLYADQKAADKTFAADKRRTAAEHAKVFIDNISAVKDADPRGSGKAGASKQGVFDIFTFTDFEGMTSALEGKSAEESVLASKWNQMRQRDLERADQALEIRQKLDEAAKAGGYKSLSDAMEKAAGQLGMASAQTHLVKLGGKEVRLTVDELMQVYADLMDSSTRALYAGGMGVVQTENAGGSKIKATLDELIEATNKLTPAQKKAADAVGVVIRSLGPDISRVHKELTGRGIDLTPDYNPRRRARETTDAPKDPPSGWAGVRGAMLENSPFTQEREGGTERARVLGGLFRDAIDYADNATRMIHLAGPVRELYAITGSGPVREALADRYGEVANKRLDQFIAAAAGTTRTTVTGAGEVIAGLNSLMASANLTLRPTTLAMNSASVIRLAPVMDPKTYADGLAGAKDVSAADINRVGYFAERFNTDPGARASGIGEAGNVSAQSRASVRRALLASLRSASRADLKDAWGAYRRAMGSIPLMNMAEMIPAKVAYAGYLAESKRLHPERTDAEHRTYAGHKAAMAFRKIQNASSAMDQTTAQLTVKGQGSAGLLLFGSDTIRTLGRLRQAKRDGQLTKFLTAEALNIATGTAMKKGFQAALVAAGASMAGNDDEWERFKKQDLALQAWSRAYLRDAFGSTVPVVGGYVVPAAERGYALATGTPQPRTFKEFEPAMLRIATDVGDLFNDVARGGEASAKGDSQRAAKAYQDALLAGGALTLTAVGAPIKPAVDYIATARRAGSAEVNTGKEAKLAGDAIRGGKAEDAAFYIGRMLRARDENKPLYQRRDEVVRLLARQGPRGNLSGQEWSEKVNAEPDLAKRVEMRAAQRDWEKLVGDAARQAARAAAGRRGEGVSSSN